MMIIEQGDLRHHHLPGMIAHMTGMHHQGVILHQGTLTDMKGVLYQMIGTLLRIPGLGHHLVPLLAAMITIDHSGMARLLVLWLKSHYLQGITFLGRLHRPYANRITLVLPSHLVIGGFSIASCFHYSLCNQKSPFNEPSAPLCAL